MADDLGWGEPTTTPRVDSPHGRIATPNLDKYFGEEGLTFEHACVAAQPPLRRRRTRPCRRSLREHAARHRPSRAARGADA